MYVLILKVRLRFALTYFQSLFTSAPCGQSLYFNTCKTTNKWQETLAVHVARQTMTTAAENLAVTAGGFSGLNEDPLDGHM